LILLQNNKCRLRIIWTEFIIWDLSLSKTTEFEILNGLSNLGHCVDLIALRSKYVSFDKAAFRHTLIPLRSVRFIVPILFTIVASFLLAIKIVFSKVDVIITEPGVNVLGLFPSIFLGRLRKVKFVLDIRSPPVDVSSSLLWRLESFSFLLSLVIAKRFFDGITIITPQMRDEISRNFGFASVSVGVWPSGVSQSVFNAQRVGIKRDELRRDFDLEDKFVVFYHGFLAEDRGLKETVEAMAQLKKTNPSIVLFFLGSGPYEQDLKDLVRKLNLEDTVRIHGAVDYSFVPDFIAMSDVGIVPLPNIPKWRTQCPLKLLEYLAIGKTVVLTDIPAHRLIVGNEECGIYARSVSPKDLTSAIISAYQNREKLSQWGKKGEEIVKKQFTWEKVACKLENYLLKLKSKRAAEKYATS
jgi:glycosyltransferase involved in cell wall biosynthesis